MKICFDKSLKPVDCDGVKMSGRSRYFDTYRFDSDMDDNAFFGSPLGATANLTDCPLDRNLLFLRSSPSDAEEPKLVVTPLMNMLRLVSFIEWATLWSFLRSFLSHKPTHTYKWRLVQKLLHQIKTSIKWNIPLEAVWFLNLTSVNCPWILYVIIYLFIFR